MKYTEEEADRQIRLREGLQRAVQNVVNRACPTFRIPSACFATALLRVAVYTQLITLGDRARVKDWLLAEVRAVDLGSDRYIGITDEDVDVTDIFGNRDIKPWRPQRSWRGRRRDR